MGNVVTTQGGMRPSRHAKVISLEGRRDKVSLGLEIKVQCRKGSKELFLRVYKQRVSWRPLALHLS